MWWTRADGQGDAQRLTESNSQQVPWSFTPDGKRLAFVEVAPPGKTSIRVLPVETANSGLRAGTPEVFLERPFATRAPMISPDGRWIAYSANESGKYRIYVEAFPGGGGKRQVSDDGGSYPAWSRNGHEIFFWQFEEYHPQGQLMVASYQSHGDSFVAGEPRPWGEKRLAAFSTTRTYDPAPDGTRIVALIPAGNPEAQPNHVVLLLNFFDELCRRAPFSSR